MLFASFKERVQLLHQFVARLVSGFREFGHHGKADVRKRQRAVGATFPGAIRSFCLMHRNALSQASFRERWVTGQQVVKRAAQ